MKKMKTMTCGVAIFALMVGMIVPSRWVHAEEEDTVATCAASEHVSDTAVEVSSGSELATYVNTTLTQEYEAAVTEDASVASISREVKVTQDIVLNEVVYVRPWLKLVMEIGDNKISMETANNNRLIVVQSEGTTPKRGELTILAGENGVVTNANSANSRGLITNSGKLTLRCGKYESEYRDTLGLVTGVAIMNGIEGKGDGIVDIDGTVIEVSEMSKCMNRNDAFYGSDITTIKNMTCISHDRDNTAMTVAGGAGVVMENVVVKGGRDAVAVYGRSGSVTSTVEITIKDGEFSGFGRGLYIYNMTSSSVRRTKISLSGIKATGTVGSAMTIAGAKTFYNTAIIDEIANGVYLGAEGISAVRLEACNNGNCNGDLTDAASDKLRLISGGEYSSDVSTMGYVKDGYKAYEYEEHYLVDEELVGISIEDEEMLVPKDTQKQIEVVKNPLLSKTGIIYTSSDETVVTVDSEGKVTGVKEGESTVTATATFDSTIKDTIKIIVPTELNGKYATTTGAEVVGSAELVDGATKTLDKYIETVKLVMDRSKNDDTVVYAVKLVDGEGATIDTELEDGEKWKVEIVLSADDVVEDVEYYTVNGERVEFDGGSGKISFETRDLGEFTVAAVISEEEEKVYIEGEWTADDGSGSVVFAEGMTTEADENVKLVVEASTDPDVVAAANKIKNLVAVYDVKFVGQVSGDTIPINFSSDKTFTVKVKVGSEKMLEEDKSYRVYYIDVDDGYKPKRVSGVSYDKAAGTVSFQTSHLSDYAVQAIKASTGTGESDGGETGGGEEGGDDTGGGETGGDDGGETGGGDGGETGGGGDGGESGGGDDGGETGGGEEGGGDTGGGDDTGGGADTGNTDVDDPGTEEQDEVHGEITIEVKKSVDDEALPPNTGVATKEEVDGAVAEMGVAMVVMSLGMAGVWYRARRGRK